MKKNKWCIKQDRNSKEIGNKQKTNNKITIVIKQQQHTALSCSLRFNTSLKGCWITIVLFKVDSY